MGWIKRATVRLIEGSTQIRILVKERIFEKGGEIWKECGFRKSNPRALSMEVFLDFLAFKRTLLADLVQTNISGFRLLASIYWWMISANSATLWNVPLRI